jgi:hypothetical protein
MEDQDTQRLVRPLTQSSAANSWGRRGKRIEEITLECRGDESGSVSRGKRMGLKSLRSQREDLEELVILVIEPASTNWVPESEGDDFLEAVGGDLFGEIDRRVVGLVRRVVATEHAVVVIVILEEGDREREGQRETEREWKSE